MQTLLQRWRRGAGVEAWSLSLAAVGDGSVTHEAQSGRGPGKGFLVDTGGRKTRWVCRKCPMLEDLPDGLAVGEGGGDPPCPPLTPGAARHGMFCILSSMARGLQRVSQCASTTITAMARSA